MARTATLLIAAACLFAAADAFSAGALPAAAGRRLATGVTCQLRPGDSPINFRSAPAQRPLLLQGDAARGVSLRMAGGDDDRKEVLNDMDIDMDLVPSDQTNPAYFVIGGLMGAIPLAYLGAQLCFFSIGFVPEQCRIGL